MNRKKLALIGGGVLLLILVVAAVVKGGDKGIPVQIATVGRENLISKVSANGKVQAVKKADISANLVGQVTRLAVKEGDVVKKGQFLMEIDPRSAKASTEATQASMMAILADLASAQASLAQAKADFERAKANRAAGIISAAEFEKAKTAFETAQGSVNATQKRVDQARAQNAQSRVGLSFTTIESPIDGVVTARRIELGETAVPGIQNQPGTVLLTISDMSKIEAEMEVDEASIPTVKLGQKAVVRIDAYPNQVFDGQVTEVGGSPILKANVNEAIKFKVKVWIKNPPLTIKPGLSAQADIFTGSRDNVVAIPIQSLITREIKPKPGEKLMPGAPRDEEGVYLVDGRKSRFVAVKTGLLGDLNVEVTDGLKGGERVITGPFKALREMKGGEEVKEDKRKKRDEKKS
jgi:HlyD family secretion protein